MSKPTLYDKVPQMPGTNTCKPESKASAPNMLGTEPEQISLSVSPYMYNQMKQAFYNTPGDLTFDQWALQCIVAATHTALTQVQAQVFSKEIAEYGA
jgi:hypothetical protein